MGHKHPERWRKISSGDVVREEVWKKFGKRKAKKRRWKERGKEERPSIQNEGQKEMRKWISERKCMCFLHKQSGREGLFKVAKVGAKYV